jgi:hypothetical protein
VDEGSDSGGKVVFSSVFAASSEELELDEI